MDTLALLIALPLLTAFLLPVIYRASVWLAVWTAPAVIVVMATMTFVALLDYSAPVTLALGGFLPPLGINFHIDQLSLWLCLAINLMMLLLWPFRKADSSSSSKMRQDVLLLILAGSSCGLAVSGDLFNLYVFYELLSVASFGLVVTREKAAAWAAGLRYLLVSGMGTVLALTGIAIIYTLTGTLNLAQIGSLAGQLDNVYGFTAFVLIVVGIGVKAELFPVNAWVPEVYSTADSRITALLAGVVSKLAVIIIVRLLFLAYASGEMESAVRSLLLTLGLLGIVWGELSAWNSRDVKRMLAFSSIGQLGMVIVAFSIPGVSGMIAGVALLFHHLLVKPALFMLTDRWSRSIDGLYGAAKVSPWTAGLFVLFALSLVGIPPLPGFWAKLLLVINLLEVEHAMAAVALGALLIATVVEAAYLIRVITIFYSSSPNQTAKPETPLFSQQVIGSILAAALIAVMVLLPVSTGTFKSMAEESSDRDAYISSTLVTASHSSAQTTIKLSEAEQSADSVSQLSLLNQSGVNR